MKIILDESVPQKLRLPIDGGHTVVTTRLHIYSIENRAGLRFQRSLQLRVFRLGLLEDRDVGVGVFPEGKEIPVGCLGLGRISRQSQRATEFQVREVPPMGSSITIPR